MSVVPQTEVATPLDAIVTGAENTLESFVGPYAKKAADALTASLGITDPVTIALYEMTFSLGSQAAIATLAVKLNALVAPKK